MIPLYFLDKFNRLLCDITGRKRYFGGKSIILARNFQQTLPVKPDKRRKCKFHPVSTEMFYLSINQVEFVQWLMDFYNGQLLRYLGFPEHFLRIPP
jgi:hypothetical protein